MSLPLLKCDGIFARERAVLQNAPDATVAPNVANIELKVVLEEQEGTPNSTAVRRPVATRNRTEIVQINGFISESSAVPNI